jgi:hypothetical protein
MRSASMAVRPAVKDQAHKALEALGDEWRALGDGLANGCKAP